MNFRIKTISSYPVGLNNTDISELNRRDWLTKLFFTIQPESFLNFLLPFKHFQKVICTQNHFSFHFKESVGLYRNKLTIFSDRYSCKLDKCNWIGGRNVDTWMKYKILIRFQKWAYNILFKKERAQKFYELRRWICCFCIP